MINPKVLGWVAIAYSALDLGTLLDLLRLVLVQNFDNGFAVLLGGAFWGSLLAGGIAMVLEKTWSKWLVRLASAAPLGLGVATLAPMAIRGLGDLPPLVVIATGVRLIPVVLIFLGSLFVRLPDAAHAAHTARDGIDSAGSGKHAKHDIAYACFLCVALVILVFIGIETLAKTVLTVDDAAAAGIGFFILIPLGSAALTSALVAIVFSFIAWRDWRLHVLSGLTVLLILTFALGIPGLKGGRTVIGLTIIYLAACISFGARWFVFVRGRALLDTGA